MAPPEKTQGDSSSPDAADTESESPRDTVGHAIFRWGLLVLALSVLYKTFLHDTVSLLSGIGRTVLPIEDFGYSCQQLRHPDLQACEDIWLDSQSRKLYFACSSPDSRRHWSPGGNNYNASGRAGTDHISVLNIDQPGADGLYGLQKLEIGGNFKGPLDLHGFDAQYVNGQLRFWLINHKPPVNQTTGEIIFDPNLGANSTVEIFDLDSKSNKLEHIKTISQPAIISPNGVAVDEDGVGFMVTNDHLTKVGPLRDLEFITGGGSVVHCQSDTGKCKVATFEDLAFPNGIVRGHDGLYYVGNSANGILTIHERSGDTLTKVDQVNLKIPMDNLSVDENGDVLVAAFPAPLKVPGSVEDPYSAVAPATVLALHKRPATESQGQTTIDVTKLIEDRDAKVLPTTTVAVRDVKSGRLFLSGVASPFVGICSPQA